MPESTGDTGTDLTDRREGRLSVSQQCELLASARRRALLRYLVARPEESVTVETFSKHLLAEEGGDPRNITLALRHVHLPKLDTAGVIEYDADRGSVRYRPHCGLERHLSFLDRH